MQGLNPFFETNKHLPKKLKSIKLSLFIVGLFLSVSFTAHAQLPPGFDDDVDDETPAAPIDGLLGLGLIAGTAIAYRKLKKSKS